jgi:hypothetical protein
MHLSTFADALYLHKGFFDGIPGYLFYGTSPDRGVPRKVHKLLLVTLRRAYVIARLSHDIGSYTPWLATPLFKTNLKSCGSYVLTRSQHPDLLGQGVRHQPCNP